MSHENRLGQGRQHYKRGMLVKLDILWNSAVKSDTKSRALRFRLLNTNHRALHCTPLYNHRLNTFSLWAQHSWFNSLLKSPNPSSYFSQDWLKSTEPSCLCWMTVNTPSVDDRGQYHKETVILKLNENLFSVEANHLWLFSEIRDLRKKMPYPYPQWIHISQETVVTREV